MGWRLEITYSDGSTDLYDEVFDTKADALAEVESVKADMAAGASIMELTREDHDDSEIDYRIWKE